MSIQYKWLRRPWRWPFKILLISVFMTETAAQRNNSSSQSCYFPSGVISAGKPCLPNAKNSVCCGPGFECLSNGICQTSPLIDTPYKYNLYRSGCTDPTFQDPACPRFCFGEEDNPTAGQGMQVCSPELGTYCCKRDYDCCTNSTLVHALGKPAIISIIPNYTAHPTQSHSPTSSATHSVVPSDIGPSATYARDTIIGVGAGFAAAMALLIIGCCFWLTRRKPERYRDKDRKSEVFEMDTLDGSRLAIHKEISISVDDVETPSPPVDDTTTRLELDIRRATMINDVVEMFELEADTNDDSSGPDETVTRGRARGEPSWDDIPSPERRAPDIPTLEASPESTASTRTMSRNSGHNSRILLSATATRPVSEYTPITGRVATPMPDIPDPGSFTSDLPLPAPLPSPATSPAERAPPTEPYHAAEDSETQALPDSHTRIEAAEVLQRPVSSSRIVSRSPPRSLATTTQRSSSVPPIRTLQKQRRSNIETPVPLPKHTEPPIPTPKTAEPPLSISQIPHNQPLPG